MGCYFFAPNSSTILEIVAEDKVLLNFDDSVEKLASEAKGFLVPGLVMYAGAAKGAWDLVRMSLGKARKKSQIS